MTALAKQTIEIEIIEMLPNEEIGIVHTLVSRIIKAWDPDFTKVTLEERKRLEEIEAEMESGIIIQKRKYLIRV